MSILTQLFGSSELEFEKYVSTAEHIAQDEDEVSFPEGVIITILHKYMDGWWFASYNNQKGYVPSSFLEPAVDSKKAEKVGLTCKCRIHVESWLFVPGREAYLYPV